MLKLCTVLLCLMTLVLLPVESSHKREELLAEEYAVYSVYLNSLKISPRNGAPIKLVVINERTKAPKPSCSQDNIARYDKRIMTDEYKALFEDLQAKGALSKQLERRFNLSRSYVFLKEKNLVAMLKPSDGDEWKQFYRKYPDSLGYLSLSRVGFNKSLTKAIIFVEQDCGALCGSGDYIIFEKANNEWKIVARFNCWIS